MNSLTAIANDYIKRHRKNAEKELRWFSIQRSLADAVSLAALAKSPSGKRLDHQRRIPRAVLEENRRRLLGIIKELKSVSSFEELHVVVSSTIGDILGIGELTIYDTALRIGAKLSLEPDRIYLHAGTRVGARRLNLETSKDSISMQKFPAALCRLKPREIENALCIYKDHFPTGKKPREPVASRCYG